MQKTITTLDIPIGVKEQIYWIEVIRGLWITNRHFWVNMWRHCAKALGFQPKERAAATYQYPEERRPVHPRWRGRHRLTLKQNGAMRCTACMLCETVCPSDCISITPGESPDPAVEKFPERFDIDILRCCFCGMCVEACPLDAIRMDLQDWTQVGYTRDIIYTKEFLMGIDKNRPWEEWCVKRLREGDAQLKDAA